jgi:hypothetical protein
MQRDHGFALPVESGFRLLLAPVEQMTGTDKLSQAVACPAVAIHPVC